MWDANKGILQEESFWQRPDNEGQLAEERRLEDQHVQLRHSRCRCMKETGLPKTLTLDSSLSNAISIHQEIMFKVYPRSEHLSPQPPWSHQWLEAVEGGRGVKHRGELARHTHSRRVWDGTSSCRTLQAQQGVWTKHRRSKASWRRGRREERKGTVFLAEGTA